MRWKEIKSLLSLFWKHKYEAMQHKSHFKSKRELLKFMSDAIGNDWKRISGLTLYADTMEIQKFYTYDELCLKK